VKGSDFSITANGAVFIVNMYPPPNIHPIVSCSDRGLAGA
jgi:hypothetical protein